MRLNKYSVAVTTTGDAGLATGSATLNIPEVGLIEWIYLDFHGNAPATTDTTIAFAQNPPGGNLLVVSNSATDVLLFPRAKCVDNANAAITNSFDKFTVGGALTISVAQCDALTDAVTVHIGVSLP